MQTFRIFDDCPVQTFFSKRTDGDMKHSKENRVKFLDSLNLDPTLHFTAEQQVHGKEVFWVTKDSLNIIVDCDALITNEEGLAISVRVADCLPVYIYSPEREAVAIIHAGWRGLAQEIISEAINQLGKPSTIKAGVGPCIQNCHFEVRSELRETFAAYPDAIAMRDGRFFIDLPKIAQAQLLNLGLLAENIELTGTCTYESEDLFSYRRDKPEEAEAMLAGIVLNYSSSLSSSDSSITKSSSSKA